MNALNSEDRRRADSNRDLISTPSVRVCLALQRLSFVCVGLAAALSAACLIGWVAGIEVLKGVDPGLPPMKVNAALGYLLVSASLLAYTRASPTSRWRRSAAVLAALAALIGTATLAEYVFGWKLGIDQLLFSDHSIAHAPYPGRPAANSAVGLVLLGCSLLCWDARVRGWWASNVFAWLAAAVGVLALFGYATGAASLVTFSARQHIALNAAIVLSVLSLAILLARPQQGEIAVLASDSAAGAALRRLLPAAIGLPLSLAFLVLAGQRAGLFSTKAGAWLYASAVAFAFIVVAWVIANVVARGERERERVQGLMVTVAQSASDAIVMTNAAGEIVYANPALESMFGHETGSLLGRPGVTLLAEREYSESHARVAEVVASGGPGSIALGGELTGVRADGREFPIEVSRGVHSGADGLLVTAVIRDVSARHRVEQRLRGLLESAPDATVVVNERGEIEFVNALAVSMFGYQREELIGEPIERLVPERHRAAHPDFWARYFADPRTRPMGTGAELYARRKDGSEFPVEITLSHVRSEEGLLVSSSIRDITERRRAEEAIARLAAIVESSEDAIIGLTLEGQITSWNQGAQRNYGYSASEAVGSHISILLSPEQEDELGEMLARVGAGEHVSSLESSRRRKDEQVIDVSVTISPIRDANGEVVGASTVARDITEQKRAERERVELLAASARAESANHAKSEFLARMSHELRTPLNSIIGFTQLVELDGLAPLQSEHTGYVLTAAGHLLELINEVLQFAKIEAGQMTISPEPVALSEAVGEALALVAPQARDHGVVLCSNTEGTAHDGHVHADRQRLKQVLLNVLSNAIKYNRPGGRVDVSFAITEGGRVRTTITDTGTGIAPEHLAKLFEPFERLGAEHTEVEGTGLGLALSRALIEVMGGRIEVASKPGIGTAVTVELAGASGPVAKHHPDPADRQLPGLGGEDGKRRVILYIEDNLSNLTLVERILERYHAVELIPAMQGRLGLELAREHRPNLIVLDLHLPDMQGSEVLKRLKADPSTREIPVVVLTADGSTRQAEHVKALGAADYLTKPLDVPKFLETVALNLDARRGSEHFDADRGDRFRGGEER